MSLKTKTDTALRLNTKLLRTMRQVKAREGIPVTTQIEIAVREWLMKRGTIRKNADRTRGPKPRTRS